MKKIEKTVRLRITIICMGLLFMANAAAAQPLEHLKPDHPRLIATAEDFTALREKRGEDRVLDALLTRIEQRAEQMLSEPTLEREQVGRRILKVSRNAVERITLLAMAYHTTGGERFARRAEAELLNVAGFTDWNPRHYLDTAEMAAAVGLGYDWLFEVLSEETRVTLRGALVEKALGLDKAEWGFDWMQQTHNWNSVCFGGMAIGALAIAEDEPDLARQWLARIRENNPRGLEPYAPDGVYPEGPGYWSYGTTYQTLLIETMRSAIGDDFGLADAPGLAESGSFMAHSRGPSGLVFNFADGSDDVGFTPAFLWTAHEAGRPEWLTAWAQDDWAGMIGADSRFTAFSALWWLRMSPGKAVEQPASSWVGQGKNPVAFFRESWTDPDAMWLAVKAGKASLNHGHMDAGSFVFEADGVRWAIDLGGAPYHALETAGVDLWNMKQDSGRWKIFQYHNLSHNTLTIDGQPHRVDATAELSDFKPAEVGKGAKGGAHVEADMTDVLGEAVTSATRRFNFVSEPNRWVEIDDTLKGLSKGALVTWTMLTEATDIEILKNDVGAVLLKQNGKMLMVRMDNGTAGRWHVEPYIVPEGWHGPPREGVTRVQWIVEAPEGGDVMIGMVISPPTPG